MTSPSLYYPGWELTILIVCTALSIGSFLNVVIHRLPLIIKSYDPTYSQNSLKQKITFSLATPRSHCPHCKRILALSELIPIISWIKLRGRCSSCRSRISGRYPLIEILAVGLSIVVITHFGIQLKTAAILVASWSLLTLAFIDWEKGLLPDHITLPLLWLGLIVNLDSGITTLHSAVMGAVTGYGLLWIIYWLFRILTKKEGLGYGDLKLLSAIGAWIGWQILPITILVAASSGLIFAIVKLSKKQLSKTEGIPFGPFLALSGWISIVYHKNLLQLFL